MDEYIGILCKLPTPFGHVLAGMCPHKQLPPRSHRHARDARLPIYRQENYNEKSAYRIYPIFKLYAEWSDEIQPHSYEKMENLLCRNLIQPSDLLKFDRLSDAEPVRCLRSDRYIFHQLKRYTKRLIIPPFQPNFPIKEGSLFPNYDEETAPLRQLDTWYDACHEMFETGSVLFQMLLVNGLSWSLIRSAIILFGRVIYYESFELELTEDGMYYDFFHLAETLQEHGFWVLILLVKMYAQSWIDERGGWTAMDFANLQEPPPFTLCVPFHERELYTRPWLLRPEGLKRKLLSEIVVDTVEYSSVFS